MLLLLLTADNDEDEAEDADDGTIGEQLLYAYAYHKDNTACIKQDNKYKRQRTLT